MIISEKHISHLYTVFQLFDSYVIDLSFKKSFFNYPTVILLKQKIDVFGFITAIDKSKAISKLDFPYIFKNLKTYLKFTAWFRGFVLCYTQKINKLQRKKLKIPAIAI